MAHRLLLDTCATSGYVTGLERVAEVLKKDLGSQVEFDTVTSDSSLTLVRAQYLDTIHWMLKNPKGLLVTTTFPPSLLATATWPHRVIPYVHDLFLINQIASLNRNARIYMAPAFRQALRRCRTFLANSETTRGQLLKLCHKDASAHLLRPRVDDVFHLDQLSPVSWSVGETLRLVAIGTVEPRKGLLRAARFREALEAKLRSPVTLDVIGRQGWGDDWKQLEREKNVNLRGYLQPTEAQQAVKVAHALVSSSFDEGLGLPLLEVQHGSKLVIASDIPTYREVMQDSAILTNFDRIDDAAARVSAVLTKISAGEIRAKSKKNVERWNSSSNNDLRLFLALLGE